MATQKEDVICKEVLRELAYEAARRLRYMEPETTPEIQVNFCMHSCSVALPLVSQESLNLVYIVPLH